MTTASLPAIRLRTLEAMRGAAALSVVVSHALSASAGNGKFGPSHFHGLVTSGVVGVLFFFTLSGFVMATSHGSEIGNPRAIPRFLWARFRRIYPIFWVVLLIQYFEIGVPNFPLSTWAGWAMLNPVDLAASLSVVWTLKVEIIFYAVLALAMMPYLWGGVLLVWVFASPLLFWWPILPPLLPPALMLMSASFISSHEWFFHFLIFSPYFLVGLAAGLLYRRVAMPLWLAWALLLFGVAVIVGRLPFDHWGNTYPTFGWGYLNAAGFGALVLGCANAERSSAWRRGGWAAVLGVVSYPAYLVHIVAIDAVARYVPMPRVGVLTPTDMFIATGISASLLAAFALAYGVDQPLQRGLRLVTPRRKVAFA
jgi:exopolysaccharide production protein ExoZ